MYRDSGDSAAEAEDSDLVGANRPALEAMAHRFCMGTWKMASLANSHLEGAPGCINFAAWLWLAGPPVSLAVGDFAGSLVLSDD